MICSQNEIKFYKDFYLTNYNTLKIKSIAKEFYMPDNYGEMITLLKKFKNKSPIIIGAGSNILFSSLGVVEPIVHTGLIKEINLKGNKLTVEAGCRVQALSKFALDKKLTGFEFLIGIPASIAGTIYMNAGAHNQTISDNFISAKVYDIENCKILTLKKEDMNFSYRHSILQERPYVLISAVFELQNDDYDKIKSRMDENLIFRKNRQPSLSMANAGSVFKNPPNCELSAGALIDKCGFRGYKLGGCEVWENHCNFIINKNNATSIEYSQLVFEIYSKVKEKYNVELVPEIIYKGKMSKEEKRIWKILKGYNYDS